jgi:hypothetical protein
VNKWVVEEYSGKVDVFLNRHPFQYDCDDMEEAIQAIKRSKKFGPLDSIVFIDNSGYRKKVQ